MNFENSLLVTVPEGHEELEVLVLLDITKATMIMILRIKTKSDNIFLGFLHSKEQRWVCH